MNAQVSQSGCVFRVGRHPFLGSDVVGIATFPGARPHIILEDIINVLGPESFGEHLRGIFSRHGRSILVDDSGSIRQVRAVEFREFVELVLASHSPKAVPFRQRVAQIIDQIQQDGYFVHPDAEPAFGGTPPGPSSSSSLQVIQHMLNELVVAEARQKAIEVRQDQFSLEIAEAKLIGIENSKAIGAGPDEWTVAAWFAWKKRKATSDVYKEEGSKIAAYCRRRGIILKDKTCNGGSFPANKYPRDVMEIWWPDYCRRAGIEP